MQNLQGDCFLENLGVIIYKGEFFKIVLFFYNPIGRRWGW